MEIGFGAIQSDWVFGAEGRLAQDEMRVVGLSAIWSGGGGDVFMFLNWVADIAFFSRA